MADPTRLELATSAVTGQRSNQLSYESTSVIISYLIGFYQVQNKDFTFLEFGMHPDRQYQDYSLPLAVVAPAAPAGAIESNSLE